MNRLRMALMLVFMGLFFGLVYLEKSRAKHILIVHSYNTDYSWVEAINEGVARALEDHPHVFTRYHYMDLKNHPEDEFKRTAARLAERVIEEAQPDVLILFDDLAQSLVGIDVHAAQQQGLSETRVVFGGMNGEPADYYGPDSDVSGILERKPMAVIRDVAMAVLEEQEEPVADPKVIFIGDRSPSITAEIQHFTSIDWAPFQWLPPVQVDTFDDWKAAVARAGEEADIILVTNYRQIRVKADERALVRPASAVMQWTEANSTVPTVGMGWTTSEDGAMLSVSASPYEQGEAAAREALALLDGAMPMGAKPSRQFLVHICQPALERRGIRVPFIHEAFARATGNFYMEDC